MKEDEETKIYNDYSGKQRQAIKLMSKRVSGEIEEMRLALEGK
jgi:tRNA 2-selenouridine synthase SelU